MALLYESAVVEHLLLYELEHLERMLVYETKELEGILWSHSEAVIAQLKEECDFDAYVSWI